jgi:predicted  nucleic acid-binding Zn-ribbon protein
MPTPDEPTDWLGDLRWQGYPRLAPIRDAVSQAEEAPRVPRKIVNARIESLARENEALRAKIDVLAGLASTFESRLAEAGSAYEGAALESDSARRTVELERERLLGELASVKAEVARRESRDAARETELTLERGRRADAEKTLLEARRRLVDLEGELLSSRGKAGELAGSIGELRRQADASHARLLQAKALTDQDVALLRQEMREFLAKFQSIQESLPPSPTPPGEAA